MALISQAPAALDLVTVKADDFTCTFTITNGGSLQDWTGVTVTSAIYDDVAAVATNFTITTPSVGMMVVNLTDTQTSTLGVGVYRYAIVVTSAGNSRTWLAGSLAVMENGWAGSSTSSASLSITTGAATVTIGGALSNAGGALGYYGAFSDYTDQTLVAAGAAKVMAFNTTDASNGVAVVSSSRLTFTFPGVYNIQWSGQFENANVADQDAQIWIRKNGVDVTGTTGLISIPSRHGGTNGHLITGWNFVFTVAAGDYIELVWTADSTDVTIQTLAATGTYPSTASLIATVTPVMHAQVGNLASQVSIADNGGYFDSSFVEDALQETMQAMYYRAQAVAGAETVPRVNATTTVTNTTGQLRLSYFTAPNSSTVTKAIICTGTTAAGATPTLIRLGLYAVATNGDLTLVASTPNDTTLLASASLVYIKSLSASYLMISGQRYALGYLIVSAAAMPIIVGTFPAAISPLATLSPRLCATVTGLADLPASILSASLTATTAMPWLAVQP